MVIFIYLCILILNLAAIFMTYKFLGDEIEKKEKAIFIIVGVAIVYMLVAFVYWTSTKNIDIGASANAGKNFITFAFVPINSILVLPFLANSYKYFKAGRLKADKLKNRAILAVGILLVALIIEFFYFKDIQNGILNIIQSSK